MKRGDIVLANLNPKKGSEVGKVRPVLILQSDLLNTVSHPTTIVLPLSTHLINDAYPLRFRITARGSLQHDSDLVIDQIRAIDNRRITSEAIASLMSHELDEVESFIKLVIGIK